MRIVTVDESRNRKPQVKFSDINNNVGIKGNVIITQLESIRQNILMIMGTSIHTKWFRPEIGNYLDNYLFDPLDDFNANKISFEVQRILTGSTMEDRIVVQKIDVIPDESEGNYFVEIFYSVPSLDVDTSTAFGLNP